MWQINGKSRTWQSISNYSLNKKLSTNFDDPGVIIMKKRCSIQQGIKKDNCWSEQSTKKLTVPFFGGHPVYANFKVFQVISPSSNRAK